MRINTSCHFIVVCVYPRFSYIVPDLSLHGFLKVLLGDLGPSPKEHSAEGVAPRSPVQFLNLEVDLLPIFKGGPIAGCVRRRSHESCF